MTSSLDSRGDRQTEECLLGALSIRKKKEKRLRRLFLLRGIKTRVYLSREHAAGIPLYALLAPGFSLLHDALHALVMAEVARSPRAASSGGRLRGVRDGLVSDIFKRCSMWRGAEIGASRLEGLPDAYIYQYIYIREGVFFSFSYLRYFVYVISGAIGNMTYGKHKNLYI